MKSEKIKVTFEDLFKDIIDEGNNIVIEYRNDLQYYKEDSFISFKIISVNGCSTGFQFSKRLQTLIREPIKKLSRHLVSIPIEEQFGYLDYIKDELNELTYLVHDEVQVVEENEYGSREEFHFKAFVDPSFKGTKDDKISLYEKSIKRKAENFAKIWLQILIEAKYKVDFLINQIDFHPDNISEKKSVEWIYVDNSRMDELKKIQSKNFDLTRLIHLCGELNDASKKGNLFTVILLVRSIIDHVPPIFGKRNFQEVANNIKPKSFCDSMKRLDESSRKIADSCLHQQIRQKEVLPNRTQVDFSNDIDVLLAEIVRIFK